MKPSDRRLTSERLELSKEISNLHFKLSKLVYNRTPVFERYLNNDITIHCHGDCVGAIPVCLVFRRRIEGSCIVRELNEFDVLTSIGEFSEKMRPVASIVRLYPLDQCDVFGADAVKKTGPLFPKDVLLALDRKLKASGDVLLRQIESRECGNQVVERCPKVLDNVVDHNLDLSRFNFAERLKFAVEGVERFGPIISVEGNRLGCCVPKALNQTFQFRQMFVCPREPQLSIAERLEEQPSARGHYG